MKRAVAAGSAETLVDWCGSLLALTLRSASLDNSLDRMASRWDCDALSGEQGQSQARFPMGFRSERATRLSPGETQFLRVQHPLAFAIANPQTGAQDTF